MWLILLVNPLRAKQKLRMLGLYKNADSLGCNLGQDPRYQSAHQGVSGAECENPVLKPVFTRPL